MADPNARDAKLIQYLTEAYAKEGELVLSLQAHIGMNTKPPYKKRLQEHLRETKSHAKQLERRIKQLGGGPGLSSPREAGAAVVGRAAAVAKGQIAVAKGPLHALRGTSEEETLLKNAKTEYWNEHEEIATYTAIETLAEAVGDKETAKLARGIRREEERMASFLERQIPALTKAVARAEIPAAERSSGRSGRRRGSSSRSSASSKSGSSKRRSSATKSKSSGRGSKSSGTKSRASSSRSKPSSTRSRASGSRSRASATRRGGSSGSSRRRTS